MADLYADIPELSAAEANILRRRKIAESINAQAMKPLESQQIPSGYVVPTNPLLALGKFGESYFGNIADQNVEEAQAKLTAKASAMQENERKKIVEALMPVPAIPQPSDEMGGGPGRPEIQKTTREKLEELIRGEGDIKFKDNQRRAELQQKYLRSDLDREDKQAAAVESKKTALEVAKAGKDQRPFLTTDNAGNSKLIDMNGNVIKDLGAVNKPSGTFEKTAVAKKKLGTDLDTAIKELEKATKDGGLIDQSTGSGAGALVDMAAGFIGKGTKGAIAVGDMKPIYDLVLKMVPRFEGPQSDKDTASYEKAAGQLANPSIPNDIKKSAGREILRLMKERKGQFFDKTAEQVVDAPAQSSGGAKFLGFE